MANRQNKTNSRRMLSWLWIYFLKFSGLLGWAERRIAASSGVVILTLHRVLPDPAFIETNSPRGMVVRRGTFEKLLLFISENFEVIGIQDNFPAPPKKSRRPRIAVTFDDAWSDTGNVAYPLTAQRYVPITVFACSGLAGLASPFWPEQVTSAWRKASTSLEWSNSFSCACQIVFTEEKFEPARVDSLDELIARLKTLPAEKRTVLVNDLRAISEADTSEVPEFETTMSWDRMQEIDGELCRFGSHTQNHEILTQLSAACARQEIIDSKKQIEEKLGHECTLFAYPNGSWSKETRDIVRQAGYQLAFTVIPGIWTSDTDPWLIPRVNIWEDLVTDRNGEFSPTVFRYSIIWRSVNRSDKVKTEDIYTGQ